MEGNEKIIADSKLLKQKADELYYLARKISKYRAEVEQFWKSSDFTPIGKEIDELQRRLDRASANMEEIAADYMKNG